MTCFAIAGDVKITSIKFHMQAKDPPGPDEWRMRPAPSAADVGSTVSLDTPNGEPADRLMHRHKLVCQGVLILLVSFGISSCVNPHQSRRLTTVARDSSTAFKKAFPQVVELKWKARHGDINAIEALARHYGQGLGDWPTAQKYWLMGAERNDVVCMHNYATGQLVRIAVPVIEDAESWSARAATKGSAFSASIYDAARRARIALTMPSDGEER